MTTLFLTGGGLPGWIWDQVRAYVREGTEVVQFPDGTGTLKEHAQLVIEAMPPGEEQVTLVAHSVSATVAAQVASMVPRRLDGVLLISSLLPPRGKSLVDVLPLVGPKLVAPQLVKSGLKLSERRIRAMLPGVAEVVIDKLLREMGAFSGRVLADATGEPHWPARRGYVLTTQDTAMPAGMQSRVAKRFDATIYQLETGHLPMLTKARELARIIERFNS